MVHYRTALRLYHDASSSVAIFALNNMAVCHIQEKQWDAAREVLEEIHGNPSLDPVLQGQVWATRAELARFLSRRTEACQYIESAKALIGDDPVSSWFTVRFLELELPLRSVQPIVHEIDDQLNRVGDPLMASALRVRLLQLALADGCLDDAVREANALAHTLPLIT